VPELHPAATVDPSEEDPVAAEDPVATPERPTVIEARDFLCLARPFRAANEVAQSTTEAVSNSALHYSRYRGVNPRRVLVPSLSSGSQSGAL
jgi:hypothetical protein